MMNDRYTSLKSGIMDIFTLRNWMELKFLFQKYSD